LARQAGNGTVGTVGEIEFEPGIINVVPGKARLSLDTRGVVEDRFRSVASDIESFAREAAERSGLQATYRQRQTLPATPLDERIVSALEAAAKASGEPFRVMASGAAHDTMCVADHVPSAMVFVPCKDGISHSPDEDADAADAALAAEIILSAIRSL
ncbi:MAG: M20/M25/M40 family metallo-hydrolase, partial [Gaiellaceae bacterium]